MMSNRLSGDENNFLRHYPSTPHLDSFRGGSSLTNNNVVTNNSNLNNGLRPLPSLTPKSSFSTFSHHKSGVDLRYRDDPNPYKVSNIDEYRIQVHDPFNRKPVNHRSQQLLTFYTEDADSSYAVDDEVDPVDNITPTDDRLGVRMISSKYDSPDRFYSRHRNLRSQASNNSTSGRSAISGSASVSTGSTGGCDIEGEFEIPDPDYDGSTAGSSEDLPIPLPDSCEDYSSVSDPDAYTEREPDACSPLPEEEESVPEVSSTPSTQISEEDRFKIECALKGRKTSIYVSNSLANLYLMSKSTPPRPNSTGSGGSSASENGDWTLKYTGVPVLLLDTGETKSRDKRKIQLVLAELGSGLALWKDVIDNLSSYRVMEGTSSFHTMHLSSDHTKIIGLSFDDEEGAERFAGRVDKLTSDFANISLSGAKTKSKNKKDKSNKAAKTPKYVKPKKTEISQPCCFHHVSSLSSNDKKRFSSLQNFVMSSSSNASNNDNSRSSSVVSSPSPMALSIPKSKVTSSGSELSF